MPTFDYVAAKAAGKSDEEIATFLKEQKAKGVNLTIPQSMIDQAAAPQKQAPQPFSSGQSLIDKIKNGVKAVGGFIAHNEISAGQDLGSGIASLTPQFNQNRDAALKSQLASSDQLLAAYKKTTDPVQKAKIKEMLQHNFDNKDVLQNPEFQKTSKQILGDFAGTALDVISAGSYGKAGAETGKLLVQGGKSAQAAGLLSKVGVGSTVATTGIAEKAPLVGQALMDFAKAHPAIARYTGYGVKGGITGGAYATTNALQKNDSMSQALPEILKGVRNGALLSVAIPATIEGTVRAAKTIMSKFSGVSDKALQRAFENPQEVGSAVKKYAKSPEQKQEILNNANTALSEIRQQRSDAYSAALDSLAKDSKVHDGVLFMKDPGSGKFHETDVSLDGVKERVDSILNKFKITSDANGVLDLSRAPFTNAQKADVEEMVQAVKNWDDITPTGLNDLRQKISAYIKPGEPTPFTAVATALKKNIADYVNEKLPRVAEMNASYAKTSDWIEQFQKDIFSPYSKASDTAKLNKLMSVFSNDKTGMKQQLINDLGPKVSSDLLNEISAAAMTKMLPASLGADIWSAIFGGAVIASHNPAALGGLIVASPRISGLAARTAGRINQVVSPAATEFGPRVIGKVIGEQQ